MLVPSPCSSAALPGTLFGSFGGAGAWSLQLCFGWVAVEWVGGGHGVFSIAIGVLVVFFYVSQSPLTSLPFQR
jgi:hypothetical protein